MTHRGTKSVRALSLRAYQVLNAGNFDNNGIEKIFRTEFSLIIARERKKTWPIDSDFRHTNRKIWLECLIILNRRYLDQLLVAGTKQLTNLAQCM